MHLSNYNHIIFYYVTITISKTKNPNSNNLWKLLKPLIVKQSCETPYACRGAQDQVTHLTDIAQRCVVRKLTDHRLDFLTFTGKYPKKYIHVEGVIAIPTILI